MKSVKPGRGPSGMQAIGSLIAVVFGIFWTIAAARMGAPFFFPLFGILFIIVGIVQAVYHYKNATGKDRYSLYDITDESEESDPLAQQFSKENKEFGRYEKRKGKNPFCPYCGAEVESNYEFCPKCGRKLP